MVSNVKNCFYGVLLTCSCLCSTASVSADSFDNLINLHTAYYLHGSPYYKLPPTYHLLTQFTSHSTIQLEDASEWMVSGDDVYKLRYWSASDLIVISPCEEAYNTYYVTNKTRDSYVRAVIYQNPLLDNPYTYRVVSLDYFRNQVCVQNGYGEMYTWYVANSDSHLLKKWLIGDAVLIGENTSWFSWFSSNDSILFNYNLGKHLKVKGF